MLNAHRPPLEDSMLAFIGFFFDWTGRSATSSWAET
jgi:hypothetical protein